MGFIHCHACGWSQDDFWTWPRWNKYLKRIQWGYNPLTRLVSAIKEYGWPRWISFDRWLVEEQGWRANGRGQVFSWSVLYSRIRSLWRDIVNMHWFTEKAWKRDRRPICPKCKRADSLDID